MKKIAGFFSIAAGLILFARPAAATVSYTVTDESGIFMYTDLANGLNATYLVFQVTSDATVPDVWLKLDTSASSIISNVGTGVHQLRFNMSAGAHGTGPTTGTGLTAGVPKAVFFLVKASTTTAVDQHLVVHVYDGDPSGSGSEQTSAGFDFKVADTIQASANKVNTVITIPNNPSIGQLGTITVTGCTGEVGSANILYFSPVSADTWPADAFEFVDSDIQIENYAGSPYRGIARIPIGDVLSTDNCYDEIFTFVSNAVGSATTTPANFISSGQKIKHTTSSSGSFQVVIPPAECKTITVSSTPATLPNPVPGQLFSATFSALPAPQVAYTFSASGLPSWLSLDPNTGVLSGTPALGDVGTVSFTITATDTGDDPAGCTGQKQFSFDVVCPTFSVLVGAIKTAIIGQLDEIDFSGSGPGTFSFGATGLPSWLSLDPVTGVVSGTPTSSDVGPVSFTVTATETTSNCTASRPVAFAVAADPVATVPTLGGGGLALLALSLAGAAFLLIRRM